VPRGQFCLPRVVRRLVSALHEAGPGCVWLTAVQDAGDVGVAAVVHADARQPQAIQVERRDSDGHRDSPLARRPLGGQAADRPLDLDDRTATFEGRKDVLQAFAIEMGVRIDETRDDGRPGQIHNPGSASAPASDVRSAADGHDTAAGDGEGGRGGSAGIERDEAAVLEDPVGGYFIHPFSRYARSAPGCRGRPTLSGCQAVLGSNSLSPA
jgi:hypothetical protein